MKVAKKPPTDKTPRMSVTVGGKRMEVPLDHSAIVTIGGKSFSLTVEDGNLRIRTCGKTKVVPEATNAFIIEVDNVFR